MIAFALLLAASVQPVPAKYVFCGISASSADEMAQAVYAAPGLKDETGTDQWRVRSNGHDTLWSVGLPDRGGPRAVVCRHVVPDGTGSSIDVNIACDGTDLVCDKVRDDFVALTNRVGRR